MAFLKGKEERATARHGMQLKALFTVVSWMVTLIGVLLAADAVWFAPRGEFVHFNGYVALGILAITNFTTLLLHLAMLTMAPARRGFRLLVGVQCAGVVLTAGVAGAFFL